MSKLTYFPISVEHGFAGNLACEPENGKTKEGKAYVRLSMYVSNDKSLNRGKLNDDDTSDVMFAYVRFYEKDAMAAALQLNKGDFIRVQDYKQLQVALGPDGKTEELRVMLFAKANGFIKYEKVEEAETEKKTSEYKAVSSQG